jgi:Domain of unknown function (DUF4340)
MEVFMKLQKSTWILVLSAILFGGIVYIYEFEGRPQREAAKVEEKQLFSFEEKDVQSVTVKTKEQTLLFERNNQPPTNNATQAKWLMTVLQQATATQPTPTPSPTITPGAIASPTPAATPTPTATPTESPKETNLTKVPGNEAYVAYLLDQMVKGTSDRVTPDPRIDYGLNQPQATIDVKLNDGKTHQLILGKPNFNKSSLYAIANPPTQGNQSPQVILVSANFENAVNRPLSEWKQPQDQK